MTDNPLTMTNGATAVRPIVAADLYCDLIEPVSAPRRVSDYLPGLATCAAISLASAFLSEHYHAPLMLLGLLTGLAFNFLNFDKRLEAGLAFASSVLLRLGIVLIGMQVTFAQIAELGLTAFCAIALSIVAVMGSGVIAAKLTGRDLAHGALAGGAVAICGASAAKALSAVLGERRVGQAQLTFTLVSVSAASALAMSLYPALAHALALSDRQAGFLMGASIHDIAQALGAGYSYSPAAGETATIVKLTRVALLGPVLAMVALLLPARKGERRRHVGVPWFVIGFVLVCALNSWGRLPYEVINASKMGSTAMLLVAVTATGMRSPMHLLLRQGWSASVPVVVAPILSFVLALGLALVLI